ncbi:MAG TPA: cytochrome c oxidase assembly protein, partial [Chloroflexota bacterium]
MAAYVLSQWHADPSVVLGLLALVFVYWRYAYGPPSTTHDMSCRRRDGCVLAIVLLTILALESPLDFLADGYLFSAHMVQHLILTLAIAPLLVLAVPPRLVEDARRYAPGWLRWAATQPAIVFTAAAADLWLWHAPTLYELTLRNDAVHVFEHLTFVATAAAFWWVAFAPGGGGLPILGRIAYVFLGGIPNAVLGALITFAPAPLYPSYQLALEQPGLGRVLELQYGVTAAGDQQLGGLLMWVPGGFVYLAVIVAIFLAWYARQQLAQA